MLVSPKCPIAMQYADPVCWVRSVFSEKGGRSTLRTRAAGCLKIQSASDIFGLVRLPFALMLSLLKAYSWPCNLAGRLRSLCTPSLLGGMQEQRDNSIAKDSCPQPYGTIALPRATTLSLQTEAVSGQIDPLPRISKFHRSLEPGL